MADLELARDLLRAAGVRSNMEDDLPDILEAVAAAARRGSASDSPATLSIASESMRSTASLPALESTHDFVSPAAQATAAPAFVQAGTNAMRREYEQQLDRLRDDLREASHDRHSSDMQASAALTAARQQAAASAEEAALAQAARARAEALAAAAREQLRAARAQLADLHASAAFIDELRAQPEDALTLRQLVLLRTHDRIAEAEAAVERARRDAIEERAMWRAQSEEAEARASAATARAIQAEGRAAGLKEQVRVAEAAIGRLQSQLADAAAQAASTAASHSTLPFGSAEAADMRRREAEEAAARATALVASHAAALESVRAELAETSTRAATAARQVELLAADKLALSASLEDARSGVRRLTEQLSAADARVAEAVRARDAMQAQCVSVATDARAAGEARLADEVRRLRETSAHELVALRQSYSEASDREVRALREARADAIAEANRLSAQVAALQAAHNAMTAAAASEAATAASALAETRGALRVKTFECEQASLRAAEAADAVRRLTTESDKLREQLVAVQAAHARADAQATELRSALHAERARLVQYERLEDAVDVALCGVGAADMLSVSTGAQQAGASINAPTTGARTGEASAPESGQSVWPRDASTPAATAVAAAAGHDVSMDANVGYTLALGGVPTTARRRLRHTMLMARELTDAQEEIAALKKRLVQTQKRMDEAVESERRAHSALEAVRGPREFLAAAYREREAEVAASKAMIATLQAELSRCRNLLCQVDAARTAAEVDVRRLLAARSEVDSLTSLVRQAIALRAVGHTVSHAALEGVGAPEFSTGGGRASSRAHDATFLSTSAAAGDVGAALPHHPVSGTQTYYGFPSMTAAAAALGSGSGGSDSGGKEGGGGGGTNAVTGRAQDMTTTTSYFPTHVPISAASSVTAGGGGGPGSSAMSARDLLHGSSGSSVDQENVYGSGFSSPVEDASGRCTPRLGATVSASQTRGTHSRPPLAAVRAHAVAHEWEVASHDMFTSHAPAQAGISITTSAQLAAASTAAGGSVSGGGSRDALRSGTRISIEAMNTTAPLAALPPPVVVEGVNSASATQRLARTAPRWHRRVALAV